MSSRPDRKTQIPQCHKRMYYYSSTGSKPVEVGSEASVSRGGRVRHKIRGEAGHRTEE